MLCFCLVSLFMALTLASLSWLGSQAAVCCQDYWDYNCEDDNNNSLPSFNYTKSTTTTTLSGLQTTTQMVQLTSSMANTTDSCYGSIENGPSCENIKHGYCGSMIFIIMTSLRSTFKLMYAQVTILDWDGLYTCCSCLLEVCSSFMYSSLQLILFINYESCWSLIYSKYRSSNKIDLHFISNRSDHKFCFIYPGMQSP